MSGKTAARSEKSEKNTPLAENENWKVKYETLVRKHEIFVREHEILVREHEALIKMLEFLEKTHGISVESVTKNKREEIVAEEEIEKWEKKFGEMQKMLEMAENDIKDLMLFKETETNRMDSGSENFDANNNKNKEADKDLVVISDDDDNDDEGSQRKQQINSSYKNTKISFLL